jgi:radical SAM/Cys-rich protein
MFWKLVRTEIWLYTFFETVGRGVFERSIAALLKLNKAGYGSKDHPELELDLVYNPGEFDLLMSEECCSKTIISHQTLFVGGAFLPGPQSGLEADYKRELYATYGIEFNHLLTIANMPIKRFADFLAKEGKVKEYMELLVNSYNPSTVKGLMCLNTVSVGWTGALYDCDFNQQLGMDIIGDAEVDDDTKRQSLSVFDIEKLSDLGRYSVRTDNHCFGCTAGSGSSCSGAVA